MLKEERHMESMIEKKHPEERGPKPIKEERPERHPEERGPKPIKEERPERHPEERGPKPIKEEGPKKHPEHILPPQEELEVMINLCGSKKELIDVLNHINNMIVEAPKKVNSEVKVRKIR
ncbi:MAG: hypothetical protein ACI31R_02655 [Bacilli bacterium]